MHNGLVRRPYGAILWVLNVQYFAMQAAAALVWATSYSWANNTISDLGNTHCGLYGGRYVCSPFHTAMNISLVAAGLTIISGALLLQSRLAGNLTARLGFTCMALAGAGSVLVGVFPENSISSLHTTGAALSFILGNLGMIVIGAALGGLPKMLRVYTVLSGIIGFTALVFFMKNTYLGIGIGGMERIVSYPQTLWMIIFGVYLLADYRKRKRANI